MRLLKSPAAAHEDLVRTLNEGYALLEAMKQERAKRRQRGAWKPAGVHPTYETRIHNWNDKAAGALKTVFPSDRELNFFLNPPRRGVRTVDADDADDSRWLVMRLRLEEVLHGLETIIERRLAEYNDLPVKRRLCVEDIDSFSLVRDISPAAITGLLAAPGYLDISEEAVQVAFERILQEPLHKKDRGREPNDLYSANMQLQGKRVAAAFLLKGNGLRRHTLELANCGKNGDQVLRLLRSPADIFIVQFAGNVSEAVISDLDGKVEQLRAAGRQAYYCTIDGQDTARVLRAYGLWAAP